MRIAGMTGLWGVFFCMILQLVSGFQKAMLLDWGIHPMHFHQRTMPSLILGLGLFGFVVLWRWRKRLSKAVDKATGSTSVLQPSWTAFVRYSAIDAFVVAAVIAVGVLTMLGKVPPKVHAWIGMLSIVVHMHCLMKLGFLGQKLYFTALDVQVQNDLPEPPQPPTS